MGPSCHTEFEETYSPRRIDKYKSGIKTAIAKKVADPYVQIHACVCHPHGVPGVV